MLMEAIMRSPFVRWRADATRTTPCRIRDKRLMFRADNRAELSRIGQLGESRSGRDGFRRDRPRFGKPPNHDTSGKTPRRHQTALLRESREGYPLVGVQ